MADTLHIRIDLARVAANFTAAERRPFTEAEAVQWLEKNDFIRQDDGWWLCEEISLGLLDRATEIVAVESA